VDLIGFEKEERFNELLESWKAKRTEEPKTEATVPPKEERDVT
jgi:hypothetical protein